MKLVTPTDSNGKKTKYSVTDTISKTAAVLVDLNRQSLSSLHSMPIVNENFRNRYFENYLQNRKISIAQASNAENSKASTNNKAKDTNINNNNNNNNNNNSTANNNNNISNHSNTVNVNNSSSGKAKTASDCESKNSDGSSNKPNETNALNTILFKPNFNLADNGNSFDEDDDFNLKSNGKLSPFSLA